jgi:hypothetical protein
VTDTPRYWKPLRPHPNHEFKPPPPELVALVMEQYSYTEAEARTFLEEDHKRYRFFTNDLYQVQVAPTGDNGDFLHINIRRLDGSMFKDWRHFQQIKNEVAGPEREALEIYPAESRKVDTSNKWHLWVLPEGAQVNLGWGTRDIQYKEIRNVPGLRQRPL